MASVFMGLVILGCGFVIGIIVSSMDTDRILRTIAEYNSDTNIRRRAIDDFIAKVEETDSYEFAMFSLGFLRDVAEELKE